MANIKPGDQVIPFTLPGVDGKDHSPGDYGDKSAVAVIFSCNHCPYVLAWEDRMIELQGEYADRVQFVAICANDASQYPEDSFPRMKDHAAKKGFNFPYVHDESQEVATAYGATHTPEVFLFDQEGVLRYHGAIDDNYDNPRAVSQRYLRDAIEAVLGGEAPSTAATRPVGCTIKWKRR
jgi:peroxiredoxin